jgi:glycosyltransferase involved in cell wall biosynthesis
MACTENDAMNRVEISIVIGTYNRKKMLINCIESIRSNGITVPYETIVIDGGSDDGTTAWLSEQQDILTIIHHNRVNQDEHLAMKRSWGYFMNLGFKSAEGKYICMLSDDLYIHPNSIMSAYNLLENHKNQVLGACAFLFRDCFISEQFFIYKARENKILVNHGMYRKELLASLGWIDEENYMFYLADTDLSLKIWNRGYQIAVSYNSIIEHFRYDFDTKRAENLVLSKENQDYLRFKEIWGMDKESVPAITKEYFPQIVKNLRMSYMPDGSLFKVLFAKAWLKQVTKRTSFLYQLLKKIKNRSFSK